MSLKRNNIDSFLSMSMSSTALKPKNKIKNIFKFNPKLISLTKNKIPNNIPNTTLNNIPSSLSVEIPHIIQKSKQSLPPKRTPEEIIDEIHANLIKSKIPPLFMFNDYKYKQKEKSASKASHKIRHEVLTNFNVFNGEEEEIKNLLYQFNHKLENKKIDGRTRQKLILNKLYGLPTNYLNTIDAIKTHDKHLSLDYYQSKFISAYASNEENNEIDDLIDSFNDIKYDSGTVKPLPPINVETIANHVWNLKKPISNKKLTVSEILEKKSKPQDQFEKEEFLIKRLMARKVITKNKRNKNLDNLPPCLREVLVKKKKGSYDYENQYKSEY